MTRPNSLMDRDDLCQYFSVCKGTITHWINEQSFPPGTKQGRVVIWKLFDIEDWIRFKQANPPENNKLRNKLSQMKIPSPKAPKTIEKPDMFTINPAFEDKILSGVINNITAQIQPKIEQTLLNQTDQIINKLANDLLQNFNK